MTDEEICPIMKSACIKEECKWYQEEYQLYEGYHIEGCEVSIIADLLSQIYLQGVYK